MDNYNKIYCKEYYKNNKEYLNAYYKFYYFLNSDDYKERYTYKKATNYKSLEKPLVKKYSPRKNKIMRIEKQLQQTAERAKIFREKLEKKKQVVAIF